MALAFKHKVSDGHGKPGLPQQCKHRDKHLGVYFSEKKNKQQQRKMKNESNMASKTWLMMLVDVCFSKPPKNHLSHGLSPVFQQLPRTRTAISARALSGWWIMVTLRCKKPMVFQSRPGVDVAIINTKGDHGVNLEICFILRDFLINKSV